MESRVGYICKHCSKQWGNWSSDSKATQEAESYLTTIEVDVV